ncbi:MAG: NUDIX hydrolase [Chloroflexi bacterium]|nr:NUDIX hydrolase [Chloroflexota bacterium]
MPKRPPRRIRDAVAAGGVVIRAGDRGREVVIAGREGMWVLPKGTPDRDERIEETATREVREETGLDVRIVRPLGTIEYWFALPRQRVHKTVHFFLMEALGGDTSRHDHEYEEVRWVPVEDAKRLLTFDTYREMLERALTSSLDPGAPAPGAAA